VEPRSSRIGAVAAGKTIDRILVGYDNPTARRLSAAGSTTSRSTAIPCTATPTHLSDWVVTTRGHELQRQLLAREQHPGDGRAHGFNFWAPVTTRAREAGSTSTSAATTPANLPCLQAFEASHEPSPWMGDRQTFQVMPSPAVGTPDASRTARAVCPFRHANEIAKPHYYGVTFEKRE
jgi:hypothetical protein